MSPLAKFCKQLNNEQIMYICCNRIVLSLKTEMKSRSQYFLLQGPVAFSLSPMNIGCGPINYFHASGGELTPSQRIYD